LTHSHVDHRFSLRATLIATEHFTPSRVWIREK
jgi:hypothetical protein